MPRSRSEILEWEGRWTVRAGIASLVAILLLIVGTFVGAAVSGDGEAEILRSAHDHAGNLLAGSTLQALGFALLALPLVVLFRAAQARSERVRPQLIGLVVAAPLFFSLGAVLNAVATTDAADQFVAGDAKPGIALPAAKRECNTELKDKGAKEFGEEFGGGTPVATVQRCAQEKVDNEAAENAISDASLTGIATGFGFAGKLGLAIALFYVGLWGMRTGLLTRFWGSLGMALGVATLLGLVLFLIFWFVYIALLMLGRVPNGRPPAWEAGEAIPWPTPGEKAAEEIKPTEPSDGDERRKRKQREPSE
ncbi:MAG TPA: hypothetical protein VFX85_13995 [Solirubrobacterales bacterium]|nr:hypothetical protein [Solirubrobacterales bacterium]